MKKEFRITKNNESILLQKKFLKLFWWKIGTYKTFEDAYNNFKQRIEK